MHRISRWVPIASLAFGLGSLMATSTRAQSCPDAAPYYCSNCDGYCCDSGHRYCTNDCRCSASATSCPSHAPRYCSNNGGYCCPESAPYCTNDGECSTGGGGGGGQCNAGSYECADGSGCCASGTICGNGSNGCASDKCCAPGGGGGGGGQCNAGSYECADGSGCCASGTICGNGNNGCPSDKCCEAGGGGGNNTGDDGLYCASQTLPDTSSSGCDIDYCVQSNDNGACVDNYYLIDGRRVSCGGCDQSSINACAQNAARACRERSSSDDGEEFGGCAGADTSTTSALCALFALSCLWLGTRRTAWVRARGREGSSGAGPTGATSAVQFLAITVLVALTMASCAYRSPCADTRQSDRHPPPADTYLRVDLTHGVDGKSDEPGRVDLTEAYTQRLKNGGFSSVMIRLPDSCRNDGVTEQEGRGKQVKDIMGTNCGVWLSELERAFVRAKFRVISWSSDSRSQDAPHQIAKKAGADLLVLINSLEVSRLRLDIEEAGVFDYAHATRFGEAVQAAALGSELRRDLRRFIVRRTSEEMSRNAHVLEDLAAVLDGTLVDPNSGDSLWFYRRILKAPIGSRSLARSFLFRQRDGVWWPVRPEGAVDIKPNAPERDTFSSRDEFRVETKGDVATNEAELVLVRKLTADFVSRVNGGQ